MNKLINMGSVDRSLRALLGVALIAAAIYLSLPQWAMITLVAVGAVLLLTALFGFCPIYALLGKGTSGPKRPEPLK